MMKRLTVVMSAVAVMVAAPVAQSLQTEEVLDLVAMPLAVAAVSEISGIPAGDLTQLVRAMNETDVAPAQFVEIVRYSPVLLVDTVNGPEVVTFVMNEVDRGITGDELVLALQERIRSTGITDFDVDDRSRVIVDRRVVVPERVLTRVEEIRSHPHGGPPGQIKKEIGVQTGAEVVHGTEPGRSARGRSDSDVRTNRDGGPPPHAGQAGKNSPADPGNKKGKGKAKGKDKNRGDR
ncbi:MAG: hypothetical protein KY432_05970 [Acidobacteria bacterium]|nr:hypothetical protein [Acidobacteriota bacterium]